MNLEQSHIELASRAGHLEGLRREAATFRFSGGVLRNRRRRRMLILSGVVRRGVDRFLAMVSILGRPNRGERNVTGEKVRRAPAEI